MNDSLPISELRRMLAASTARAEPTPDCLDDDTVAELAEGTLPRDAHCSAVAHLARCARCRGVVASVVRVLVAPAVAREATNAQRARQLPIYRIALPLAAAAALALLVVRPVARQDAGSHHRGPTITAAPAPVPITPVGVVSQARLLRWNAVPLANRYRVTLFDAGARLLYETEVSGTSAALPDSVVLVLGARYLWKVEASTGFDRWSASDLVDFSIAPGHLR